MLTIFWSLTIGLDEPIPLFWRDQQHPCNLPPLLSREQLEKARHEQRVRQEATSHARREVRRALGVSRHKTLALEHQQEPQQQLETIDTFLLYYLLSYPFRALRTRYYAAPRQWSDHYRLDTPVAYIMTLDQTRQRSGFLSWWYGSVAELASYTITRGTLACHEWWQRSWRSSSSSSSSSSSRSRIWTSIYRQWICNSTELVGFVISLPFYRAYIYQSVLASANTTQLTPVLQQNLARHSSIGGQWTLLFNVLRHPMTHQGIHYWQYTFPTCLLYHIISTRLMNYLMQYTRSRVEQAETNIATTAPLSSSTSALLTSHTMPIEMAPINLSNDTTNKHRRRLWRSSAWSTIHLSTMLLTQILLAPLEALSTRLILDSITDGSSVIMTNTMKHGRVSSGIVSLFISMLHLTGHRASWSGLVCECLLAMLVAQVDWFVCKQFIRWQSSNNTSSSSSSSSSNNHLFSSSSSPTIESPN